MSQNTTEKMHQVRLRHQGNTYMRTKTLTGKRHTVAWPAGSWAWCARGPRIETRCSHHVISHPILRQIPGVRVNQIDYLKKMLCFSMAYNDSKLMNIMHCSYLILPCRWTRRVSSTKSITIISTGLTVHVPLPG